MSAAPDEPTSRGDDGGVDSPDAAPLRTPIGTAVVVVASDRAASGVYADRSGALVVDGLRRMGIEVADPLVVADGAPVGEALRSAIAGGADLVVTTGGTGITARDRTPEETEPLLERRLDHLAALIVAHGVDHGVPTAVLSRGLCGVAGSTLVVNLPGSTGGVRDGLEVLAGVLPHALDQLRGGGHR